MLVDAAGMGLCAEGIQTSGGRELEVPHQKDGAGKEGKVGPKSGAHDPNIRWPYILFTLAVQAYSAQKQS